MIWPFKPRLPMSLLQKVIVEKCVEAAVQAPGLVVSDSWEPVPPGAMDPIFESANRQELPTRLLEFFKTRMPAAIDAVLCDHELRDEYVLVREGDSTHLYIRGDFAELPYQLSADILTAMSDVILAPTSLTLFGVHEILPVLYGFGAVMSNSTLRDVSESDGRWEIWKIRKRGHLSAVEHGYAMAICDTYLQTKYGTLLHDLRQDAAETYVKATRFLRKSGDTCLSVEFPRPCRLPAEGEVVDRLTDGTDTVVFATLIDAAGTQCSKVVAAAVGRLLGHRESCIRRAAIEVVSGAEEIPQEFHDELVSMVEFESVSNRLAALSALRTGYSNDESNRETVYGVMARGEIALRAGCLIALNNLTETDADEDHLELVLGALGNIAPHVSSADMNSGLELLGKMTADPSAELQRRFSEEPTELAILLEVLEEYQNYLGVS